MRVSEGILGRKKEGTQISRRKEVELTRKLQYEIQHAGFKKRLALISNFPFEKSGDTRTHAPYIVLSLGEEFSADEMTN